MSLLATFSRDLEALVEATAPSVVTEEPRRGRRALVARLDSPRVWA